MSVIILIRWIKFFSRLYCFQELDLRKSLCCLFKSSESLLTWSQCFLLPTLISLFTVPMLNYR